jgi:hypothetical protein
VPGAMPRAAECSTRGRSTTHDPGWTVEEIERIADGEEPATGLGPERAARLSEALDG